MPAAEPIYDDAHDDGEQEDLGYYPDGVKRTLTDEQIRIFRHSEIHALLRERQLKQDEAEYEARREKNETESNQSIGADNNAMGVEGDAPTGKSSVMDAQSSSQQQSQQFKPPANIAQSEYLDYGESGQTPTKKGLTQEPTVAQPRRRIISYED